MLRPTKDQIRELPLFTGISLEDIVVVENLEQAEQAIAELSKSTCLGFDTESKPCFKKDSVSTGPHLIQFSSERKAFLFPTKFLSIIPLLDKIMSNPDIKKVGFGLSGDKRILYKKFGLKLVNTQDLAIKLKNHSGERQRIGIRAAVAMLFNQRLPKSSQLSNWSQFPLEEHQLKYAANDAYASLRIEHEINNAIELDELAKISS